MTDLLEIMVVEDDQQIQRIVEEALSDGGFEPAIASSGEEALALLSGGEGKSKYRVLVIDIKLGKDHIRGPSHNPFFLPTANSRDSPNAGRGIFFPTSNLCVLNLLAKSGGTGKRHAVYEGRCGVMPERLFSMPVMVRPPRRKVWEPGSWKATWEDSHSKQATRKSLWRCSAQ